MLQKHNLYVKNINAKPFADGMDLTKYLKSELDIHENDNFILMTYKLVINKNDVLDLEYKKFDSWPADWFVNNAMCEFNQIFKSDIPFKIVVTVEKTKEENGDNEKLQYLIQILVNIRCLNIKALQNTIPHKMFDCFDNVEFYSVANPGIEHIKLPNEIWCIAPVANPGDVINVMLLQHKKDSKHVLIKYGNIETMIK